MATVKEIREAARTIPVLREVDVLVAGGGTAGMVAGLAAARAGAQTLVLERLNCLGGNFTAGLMGTTWTFSDQKKLIVRGIPLEIIERLAEQGGTVVGNISKDCFTIYDTELAKFVLQDMYEAELNLEVLYYTWVVDTIVEDNVVKGVIIESKSGRQAILAKTTVDATGDADVAARAKAEFMMAAKQDLHPVSLLCKIANVDLDEMFEFYERNPSFIGNFTGGWQHSGFHCFRLNEELQNADLPLEMEYLRDWFILFYTTPRPGEIIFNMTGETQIDGTDVVELTKGELVSRKRLSQALWCLRQYVPGFKNAYITTTASSLGVRETRRIVGEHILTKDEIVANTRFPDAVCSYGAPVGVHTADGTNAVFARLKPGTSYDIPYRCLLPKKIDGLLVTGRCISVTPEATGSTRNMTACMALGQASGVAAALASAKGIVPRALGTEELVSALLSQGVYLEGRSALAEKAGEQKPNLNDSTK
ncbi:FAD-dependent oxidoreductase [Gelria sp. Kuro-4]|uniref:FAD-dependent oxidoreductase n=1 Tax=Gelria sp. Kuro-4 TaxID=2796927 RepID=UPI001BEEF529|nr:FAD-dependent oxidoreductase [Gelria sp. Kuro-4]BCV24883.1 hypothetical protein kuro4_16560 [Gelria sp. Kuro-4]